MTDFLCLGELLVDWISRSKDCGLRDAGSFAKFPGGAPANVAVGLARLGAKAGFVGKVGDDPFGDFLASVLSQEGVETSGLLRAPGIRTSLAFIADRSDGKKDILFYRHPGADTELRAEELPEELITGAVCFHFGSVSLSCSPAREATLYAAELARRNGVFVSFDPNYRPDVWDSPEEAVEWINRGCGFADLVKLSGEEFPVVTGESDLTAGCGKLLRQGVRLVVVTLAEQGCYYDNGSVRGTVPGYRVPFADSLGAGDAFQAGLLFSLRREGLLEKTGLIDLERLTGALRFANAAGGLTASRPGAIPALPTLAEVEALITKGVENG